ncbi:MAG TPA: M20/M25/M40 family metallo-hydrolase [Bacteroidales bacterium]|nr:M20/M25/M40 family metallo-hydrolase [Bacteroidales bacterium]
MIKKQMIYPLIILILSGMFSCNRIALDPDITRKDLFRHIDFLAGDSLKGRYPGTSEDKAAAEYIAEILEQSGAELLYNHGLQAFEVVSEIEAGENNVLHFQQKDFHLNEDFTPLSYSASAEIESEAVFVGYGLTIEEEEFRWNDYDKVDVQGKIALILRGGPNSLDERYSSYSGLRSKAIAAKDRGAAGVIFVSGPQFDEEDELLDLNKPEGKLSVPVIQIKRGVADQLLAKQNQTIKALEESLNEMKLPHSFYLKQKVLITTAVHTQTKRTFNVAAQLKRSNHSRYIVIGAHYDHLGFGGPGTGSRMPDTTAVHNGADDNASGVAAMLEIAQKLVSQRDSLNTNFLFVAFGAEEMGLLGSKHFVNHLPVADSLITAMINIDMVGRLKADRSLQIGGVGTSAEADSVIKFLNKEYRFTLGLSREGYGPSDHSSFYSRNIPVFFYSTGAHIDYHTPNDTTGVVNFEGLVDVSRYIYDLAYNLSFNNVQLTFREAGPKVPNGDYNRRKLKVTLGIMPDFSGVEKRGLRADMVIKDKPAYKAGIESGDIIVAMDGMPVGDIYEYMERLNKFKPGQIITVEVIRGEERKVFIVQL